MSRTYFGQDVKNLKNIELRLEIQQKNQKQLQLKREEQNKMYNIYDDESVPVKPLVQLWDINNKDLFKRYYRNEGIEENEQNVQNVQNEGIQSANNSKKKQVFNEPGSSNFIPEIIQLQNDDQKKDLNEITKKLKLQALKYQKQNEEAEQEGKKDEDAKSPSKINKKVKKTKLLKSKQENFVKMDMKRKWTEKYRGQLYVNKTYYTKNGKQKNRWDQNKKENEAKTLGAEKNDFQLPTSAGVKVSNIYMQSISSALVMDLFYEGNQDDVEQKLVEMKVNVKKLVQELNVQLNDELFLQLLSTVFNHKSFRIGQLDSIRAIMRGESVLMVQKTGFGKSLIYQMLSLLWSSGIGIVFSPLVSLMIDQIAKLPKLIPAVAYHSLLTSVQRRKLLSMIGEGQVRLLFCTPEIFQNDLAFYIQSFGKINFIVIDEAHCVSELSQNFRPTYIVIDQLIRHFLKPHQPPYLALTATATVQTINSIQTKFRIQHSLINQSTARDNLLITTSRDREVNQGLITFLNKNKHLRSVIIYARSRYMVDSVSNYLQCSGMSVKALHAGMDDNERLKVQSDFMSGLVHIIIATSVFAMGIDKPDVRCVLHLNLPKSMESYIQEVGRAGRDGKGAQCHLFLNENDYHIERGFIIADFPDKNTVQQILSMMKLRKKVKQDEQNSRVLQINAKESEKTLDLKKETIFTIMRILETNSSGKIKVYPMGHEKIVLRFFTKSMADVASENEFLSKIIELGRVLNGQLIVPVVKCCNALGYSPMEVLKRCKLLYYDHTVTCEVQEEIIPFEYALNEEDEDEFLLKVFAEMEVYKACSLEKLNYLYLSMQEHSYFSVDQMMLATTSIKQQQQEKTQKFYDLYFNSSSPLADLVDFLYPSKDEEFSIDELLPFDQLDETQRIRILSLINRFLREETALISRPMEKQKKLKPFLEDPKVLAKILCGIQSINFGYAEWKNNNLWGSCKRNKYEEVYNVILDMLANRVHQLK